MINASKASLENHYDFIVVGAGAAGSVLAAELSAAGAHVLVIESGGPDDAPTITNPSIWFEPSRRAATPAASVYP